MQNQKTSNFVHSKIKIADIGLQNPLVKKKQNTTQQQRVTQVQKMKTANKVQKAKQTSRVVVWGVGGGGRSLCEKENSYRIGMLQPYTKSDKA